MTRDDRQRLAATLTAATGRVWLPADFSRGWFPGVTDGPSVVERDMDTVTLYRQGHEAVCLYDVGGRGWRERVATWVGGLTAGDGCSKGGA
jgi:hypothetical protein